MTIIDKAGIVQEQIEKYQQTATWHIEQANQAAMPEVIAWHLQKAECFIARIEAVRQLMADFRLAEAGGIK